MTFSLKKSNKFQILSTTNGNVNAVISFVKLEEKIGE